MPKELDRCFLETAVYLTEIARLKEKVYKTAREFDAQIKKRKELREIERLAKERPNDVGMVFKFLYPRSIDQEMLRLTLEKRSPLLIDFLSSWGFFEE